MEHDGMELRVLDAMIRYNGSDMRRVNHAVKVWGYAKAIADRERRDGRCGDRDEAIISIAAILHDIGIHEAERRHGSSAGEFQESEGPAVAKELLAELPIQKDILDRVLFLIGHHHSYGAINGVDFRILVEADFIVNIDEDRMDAGSIAAVRKSIFRTAGGTDLLDSLYPA